MSTDDGPAPRIWRARCKLREAADAVTDLIAEGVRKRDMERVAEKMDDVDADLSAAMTTQAGEDLDRRMRAGGE